MTVCVCLCECVREREREREREKLTAFLKPRKEPKKVRGSEIPNQRQSKASRVVKGMAADDPAPQRRRLRKKNTPNVIPGIRKEVIRTLVFQRKPPITVNGVCVCMCVRVCVNEYVCV